MRNGEMLSKLYDIEHTLPSLLPDTAGWHSLLINYHPPVVRRLWRDHGPCRVYLHDIFACTAEEALFHPHPWPSAMRVVEGTYEMVVGYGAGDVAPPAAATLVLGPGTCYEMIEPDGWHSVRPLDTSTLSLMVTGAPWERLAPKSDKPLAPLESAAVQDLLHRFARHYGQSRA
jgi:hypothetical protein